MHSTIGVEMDSEILTPLQKSVLEELFRDNWFRENFYLTGGTALAAFYLFHRRSYDLDFFSHEIELDAIEAVVRSVGRMGGLKIEQVQKRPQFIRYQVGDELQLDFVTDVPFHVDSPSLLDQFMVDSLKNIAVNKVSAILGRLDPKDYVDLYFILKDKQLDIFELLQLGAKKDAGLEPFVWASLVGAAEISLLPHMVRPITIEELQDFYRALRNQILDSIKPT